MLSRPALAACVTSFVLASAFGDEAVKTLFSFDGPEPTKGWKTWIRGTNPEGGKGEVRTAIVPGRAGGNAVRFVAEDAGHHSYASPMVEDGPWRERKYGAIELWYRGDGSKRMWTLVVFTKRDEGKGYVGYVVRLYLYSKEWQRVVLRHIKHRASLPDPDLSKLAYVRFEGRGSYQVDIGPISLLPAQEITRLKPLCVETPLVRDGRPVAAIVPPATRVGRELAKRVQKRLKDITKLNFPVVAADAMKPRKLLQTQHVVVLGCMADNPFFERLYQQWFTITDRWYPGPGGHVLRSVHNPYGTGWNVILVGASDDRGLRDAVAAFERALAQGLTLPWLMDIKLGDGHEVPDDAEAVPILLRPFADNCRVENGWSQAGKLALQYLYSGDAAYVQRFKKLVAEKPESLSKANHYGGGQTQILVWDLIEESPVFADEERLEITQLLLKHLRSREAAGGVEMMAMGVEAGYLPARHALTMMQGAAVEARYFARDYPRPEFTRYQEMCGRYFGPLMKCSKTQNDVRVGRYTTYLEPLLSYALLHGRDDFLLGEPLRVWADRIVAHVPPMGLNHRERPFGSLRAVAQLRRDGQYRYVADLSLKHPPMSLYEFSSAQAWAGDVTAVTPTRYTGVCALAPEPWEFEFFQFPVKPEHGFDKVTLRNGFEPDSLWLQLDGVDGGPGGKRTPDVMGIKWLGGFGHLFLRWWTGAPYTQSAVCVSRDGLSGERPRAAELVATANLPNSGYVHARTKDYPWSHWSRHLVWDKPNNWIAVFDRVTATDAGRFLASAHWIPFGSTYLGVDGEVSGDADGFRIVTRAAGKPSATLHVRNVLSWPRRKLVTLAGGELEAGDDLWLVHLLALRRGEDKQAPVTRRLAPNAFVIEGDSPVIVGIGPTSPALFGDTGAIDAKAFRIDANHLHLAGATKLVWREPLIQADSPVDIELAADGSATIEVHTPTRLVLAPAGPSELAKGSHTIKGLSWAGRVLKEMVSSAKPSAYTRPRVETLPSTVPAWSPSVAVKVPGKATAFAAGEDSIVLGYEDGTVRAIAPDGKERWTFKAEKMITGLKVTRANGDEQWRVLAGSDDGHVYALDGSGKEVWRAELHAGNKGARRSPFVREFLLADVTDDGAAEVIVPNTERWLAALDARDGSELWATRIPPHYSFGDLLFPRALAMGDGVQQIAIGEKWFYGGGWMRVNKDGKVVRRVGGMWGGGRVSGIAVADFDGDDKSDVCVARYRVTDVIELYSAGDSEAWTVWTDEPVTSLVALPRAQGGSLAVAGTRSGCVVALDAAGEVVWSHCLIASVDRLVCLRGALVAVALADGRLVLLDAEGAVLSRAEVASCPYQVTPTSSASALYAVTDAGRLVRFDSPKP